MLFQTIYKLKLNSKAILLTIVFPATKKWETLFLYSSDIYIKQTQNYSCYTKILQTRNVVFHHHDSSFYLVLNACKMQKCISLENLNEKYI